MRELKIQLLSKIFENYSVHNILEDYLANEYNFEDVDIMIMDYKELRFEYSSIDMDNCQFEENEDGEEELIQSAYIYTDIIITGNDIVIKDGI